MTTPRLILVGRVAGGFGVRGEVRITAYTADPMALLAYRELKRADGSPGLTLTAGRPVKDGFIGRAAEIETKEQADALRGLELYVPRDALPEPEEDEFYLADLIGLEVRLSAPQDPARDGRRIGAIKAVQNFGAGDVLEIDPGDGRPTWYLPFTREAVPQVRIAEGHVVAAPPPETSEREPD